MHLGIFVAALAATSSALTLPRDDRLYTIELGPGEIQTVTEAQKWELKAVSHKWESPISSILMR